MGCRALVTAVDRGYLRGVSSAVIGPGLEIIGEIRGAGALVVEGRVEGRISVDALDVKAEGEVDAEIEVRRAVVAGRASGHVTASESIHVNASATVTGDVRAPSVVVEEGAHFRGRVHMDVGLAEEL